MNNFFFGTISNMELPTLKWWNSKRKEYNLRFISCLLISQLIMFLVSFSLGGITSDNLTSRISSMLVSDLLLIVVINIIYFIWPAIERIGFKNSPKFRLRCFAFINGLSLMILIGALILMVVTKT